MQSEYLQSCAKTLISSNNSSNLSGNKKSNFKQENPGVSAILKPLQSIISQCLVVWHPRCVFLETSPVLILISELKAFNNVDLPTQLMPHKTIVLF